MKELYVHIGFHKTGTSSIQSFLFSRRKQLASAGVLYPQTGLAGDSHNVLANSLKLNYDDRDRCNLFTKFRNEIQSFPGEHAVVSSECFMESIDPAVVYSHLATTGAQLKVIIYVRPQPGWAESLYNEIVKDSSRRYSGHILQMREIRRGDLDYHQLIMKWANAFGDENIIVRPFDLQQLEKGIYHDFSHILGAQIPDNIELPDPGNARNTAWDARCIEFLRRINLLPMLRGMHQEIVQTMDSMQQEFLEKFGRSRQGPIDRKVVMKIIKGAQECNRLVAAKWVRPGLETGLLFVDESSVEKFCKQPVIMEPEVEHWIFGRLPTAVQEHLMRFSPSIAAIKKDECFLPIPPCNEERRLRSEILRLRMELNWLYAK